MERPVFTNVCVLAVVFWLLSAVEIGRLSPVIAGETTSAETAVGNVYPDTLSPSLFCTVHTSDNTNACSP